MDSKEYIDWALIEKSFNSKLTDEEDAQLSKWLAESPRHREFYLNAVKENSDIAEEGLSEWELNEFKANFFKKIEKRSRKAFYKKVLLYAAAVIPPLIVLFSLFYNNTPPVTKDILADFSPGTSKAVLVLDNGKQIKLGDSTRNFDTDYSNIRSSVNQVTYNSKDQLSDEVIINKLVIPRGGEYSIVLSDGTKVWLNSESNLEFPAKFTGQTREVSVSGEAYFEVAPNKMIPFIIKTDDFQVRVTGTSFNINSYKDSKYSNITVESGNVIVSLPEGTQNQIGIGQQLSIDRDTKSVDIQYVELGTSSIWKDGIFYFDKESLESIMTRISRWYDFQPVVISDELKQLRFVGKVIKYDNASKVMDMLKSTEYLNYTIDGQRIIIY
jgi:transmembrane sensor